MIGRSLGPYQVVAKLGEGGMGEVYRARDTKLNRDVALKILPESFASDADRQMRFTREAQTLASLNHPNIAAIYGIEDRAIVMELVDGRDLSELIAAGPRGPGQTRGIPLDEALPIARQIAEALEAAHDAGIIHRDLKPANIKVRDDGTVKVLDFGLAKALGAGGESREPKAESPTMTSPAITQMGLILGTAPYMAPEQARGRPLDRRADIWAFGCVLYEMLTATRAFPGDEITDVIAAIITREPDFEALPASTPPHVRALLRRCFVKDPKQRLRDIGEARLQLGEFPAPVSGSSAVPPANTAERPSLRRLVPMLAGALVLVSAALIYTQWRGIPHAAAQPQRLAINFPEGGAMHQGIPYPSLAYSPDGQTIVYTSGAPDGAQLYLRRVNEYTVTPIPGARGRQAFFSPDGKWIGFITPNEIRKVPLSLGPPTTITPFDGPSRGATWTDNNEIVFVTGGPEPAMWRVPADGGSTPTLVTNADVSYPGALPGGRAVLVTLDNPAAKRSSAELFVAAVTLETGAVTKVLDGGTYPRWSASGHIVYLRDNTLMATPFDPVSLSAGDARVPVVPDIYMDPTVATGNFAISESGALAYLPGSPDKFVRGLVAVDPGRPASAPEPVVPMRRQFGQPRLSPDGKRIAVVDGAWVNRIVIIDIERTTSTQLTSGALRDEGAPVWSSDSKSIIFRAWDGQGRLGLYRAEVDGTGEATLVLSDAAGVWPTAWSADGRSVVVHYEKGDGDSDLMLLTLGATPAMRPLLSTSSRELNAALSADGSLIAYQSNRSGSAQTYVATFPAMTGTRQVSVTGGTQPVWPPRGRRLYYRQGQRVMTADVTVSPLAASPPAYLIDMVGSGIPTSFVEPMPDGRLLMLESGASGASSTLHVILNWFTELRDTVR